MLRITDRRIQKFCRTLLQQEGGGTKIGFVDVGSGGELKAPWALLPPEQLTTFDFEPTKGGDGLPLCVSNKTGQAEFYVAHDERASSFHKPLPDFVERYAFDSMLTKKTITVACTSLDEYFAGRYQQIDAIDINVEGHDYQVLQGAPQLLAAGAIKLLKIEFELIPVYQGQGYFADIDICLRGAGFRLADLQVDHVRTAKVRQVFHPGEPMWGKALYAPTRVAMSARLAQLKNAGGVAAARREMAAALALYAAAKLPGYGCDVIEAAQQNGILAAGEAAQLQAQLLAAFRWAKPEEGVRRLRGVGTSLANVLRQA